MGRAARQSIKPRPLPVTRATKDRPTGNRPDGAKPMLPGEMTYNITPPTPKTFK